MRPSRHPMNLTKSKNMQMNPEKLPTVEQAERELKRLRHRKAYRRALRGTISVLIVVAAISVLIATLFLPVLQIAGESMEPTLGDGDIIVLLKTDNFEYGDLCGFYWQNRLLLKRVIALPGSCVEIDADGYVAVDGELLDEPYVTDRALGECDITFPFQVPDGKLFVMGDHRTSSIDSRSTVIGCIEQSQIVGRVLFRVWPLKKIAWLDK